MGLFDGRSYSSNSGANLRPRSSSRPRGASPARSAKSDGRGFYSRRPSSARSASFFGGSVAGGSRGIFGSSGGGGSGGSSSYYRRRPRDGYISYLLQKLQRMIRELWYYAKRNPVKAFFAVVVPLLSAGGAIHGLLKQFGVRIPGLDGGPRRGGGGYYGSSGYEARGGGGGDGYGGGGWMDNAGSLMQIARAFM